jgi:hypothetical protein
MKEENTVFVSKLSASSKINQTRQRLALIHRINDDALKPGQKLDRFHRTCRWNPIGLACIPRPDVELQSVWLDIQHLGCLSRNFANQSVGAVAHRVHFNTNNASICTRTTKSDN